MTASLESQGIKIIKRSDCGGQIACQYIGTHKPIFLWQSHSQRADISTLLTEIFLQFWLNTQINPNA